jgi:hypothetical protein
MRKAAGGALGAALLAFFCAGSSVAGQVPEWMVLRAGTPVPLVTLDEVSSKTHSQGDRFAMRVSENVSVAGHIVIPRGASAVGEVARHTAKGSFGRAGELEVQLLHVEVSGRRIRLDGDSRRAGKNATVPAAAVGAVIAGFLGSAITGKHAIIPVGTPITGYIHRDVPLQFHTKPD